MIITSSCGQRRDIILFIHRQLIPKEFSLTNRIPQSSGNKLLLHHHLHRLPFSTKQMNRCLVPPFFQTTTARHIIQQQSKCRHFASLASMLPPPSTYNMTSHRLSSSLSKSLGSNPVFSLVSIALERNNGMKWCKQNSSILTIPPIIPSIVTTGTLTYSPYRYFSAVSVGKIDTSNEYRKEKGQQLYANGSASSNNDNNNSNKNDEAEKKMQKESKLKVLVKQYGSLVWKTYWGIYFGTLGTFFVGIQSGVLAGLVVKATTSSFSAAASATASASSGSATTIPQIAYNFMISHSWLMPYAHYVQESPTIANFCVSFVMAEASEPIRILATCAVVPLLANHISTSRSSSRRNEELTH